ncbi:MAG: hypothetical protein ACE5GJ_04655 [Gemmatimonadota bacterium]
MKQRRMAALVALGCLLPFLPQRAEAQQGGPGFLFRSPRVTLSVRAGYDVPRARSQVFDFVRSELTLDRRDFAAPSVDFSLAVRVSERLDLGVDVGTSRSESLSEFRDWVDLDGLPIEQTTTFRRTPVTLSLRYYLTERGRRVSRLAWVPRRWTGYVGVAAGRTSYSFEQAGDFVDFETLDIFRDRFLAEGSAPLVQALGGVEYNLTPYLALSFEGRFSWARGDPGRDFVDFDSLDLSGFRLSAGASVRF